MPLEKNRYRLVSNTTDVLSDLSLPLEVSNVRRQATFTIAIRQVENYRSGRVYLAGDAAHCHYQGEKAINGSERFRVMMTNNNWLTANLVSSGFCLINQIPKLQAMVAKNIVGD